MPRRKRIFTQKNLRAMGMDRHSARAVNKATARLGCLSLAAFLLAAMTALAMVVAL